MIEKNKSLKTTSVVVRQTTSIDSLKKQVSKSKK
jgi:hypothetical protein